MDIQIDDFFLTVNGTIIASVKDGYIATGKSLNIDFHQPPKSFFRHGWQSWSLANWINPNDPLNPISIPQTRAKDEDIPYAFSDHPVSAWVGASELNNGLIVLLGSLDLCGRVEINGTVMNGFYEDGHEGKWLIVVSKEEDPFACYANALGNVYGRVKNKPPRVWCSWYSLYNTINEPVIDNVIGGIGEMPFDVIQIDDGWEISLGEWEANKKFPSGMKTTADKIRVTGRQAGLWLAPFIIPHNSKFAHQHADWILRHENGNPVYAGIGWSGELNALDSSHPEVLKWLEDTIQKVVGWGFSYLKLDFLYAAAIPGKRKIQIPREISFRQALQVIRKAAGNDTFLLACGSPIIPVLGIFDGIRIGPDVAPFWISKPLSIWVNNPNNPGTQNALRTSLHRLWLKDLIHIDPDVAYFRTRHTSMTLEQIQLLQDLIQITGFKATSDVPQWLKIDERKRLKIFLEQQPVITQRSRYEYSMDGRIVDFSSIIPLPDPGRFPPQLALLIGLVQMGLQELLPAMIESSKAAIIDHYRGLTKNKILLK